CACLLTGLLLAGACKSNRASLDDTAGGRKPEDFPELADDVFKPMDGGIALSVDEIKGRNTWNLWTGGNEQFWERMSRESYGLIDLLKTIDSRNRASRFQEMGLINQPGYRRASKPDEYGLWIDEADAPEPTSIDPNVYGRPTGIMGFRLFPNPDFDAKARQKWDGERYYRDADYAASPELVRPYRVGVSCGACHIAFNPLSPPADPANPKWENLSSAIGNQYIREGRTFASNVKEGGFFWEMLKAQPPGTSDTSRIATDNINNPNTINPIFLLGERLAAGHDEVITSDETRLMPGIAVDEKTHAMKVPMVLKDGADSVGVPGATLRVYINIGMYSQHWLQQHNALVGLTGQKPFEISTAQKHSVYWLATQQKFENIARFFARLRPVHLADAPGGDAYLTKDGAVLRRGAVVFGENCATCHSSKRPPAGADEKAWFAKAVLQDDFRENNFFADERRYSVAKIGTNASRAFGTNAKAGHIWANFSSDTYKNLPPIDPIEVYNPYTDRTEKFPSPSGGPGYYRPASLIGLWTSAPFFHNNALGKFTGDPSVAGRMEAFNDAVEKLLWPDLRPGTDSIWRTSRECNVQIQAAALPKALRVLLKPHLDPDGYFRLGPIPEGTPINLIANIDPDADPADLAKLFIKVKTALLRIKVQNLDAAAAKALMRDEVAPAMFAVSKCPDLIEDRGHLFGTELPEEDKRALIEYLKTL
ncbi:MAG TPA: hypothetical protein VNR00_02830, partial [Opitutus sp.]|nr:hypothetical protein [Opitutus sp.]